jgi:hypothetical protein
MANSILQTILAAVDNTKRAAARNVRDLFSDPKNAILNTLENTVHTVREYGKDPANFIGRGLGTGAGIIRKGGATDLNMYHGTSHRQLARAAQEFGEDIRFSHPSIAIASNNANPFVSDVQLLLNPSYRGFDPRTNPANQLYNTDGWVTRDKSDTVTSRAMAQDLRLTEGESPSLQHALSILASPRFTFESFEKAALGAPLLRAPNLLAQKKSVDSAESALSKWLMKDKKAQDFNRINDMDDPEAVKELFQLLRSQAYSGSPEAKKALKNISSVIPSYAELKMIGDLPLTPETVSGVMIHNVKDKAVHPFTREELAKRIGIDVDKVGTPAEILPKDVADTYKNLTEVLTKKVETTLKKDGNLSAMMGDPYMWTVSTTGAKEALQEGKLYELIGKSVVDSPEFAADVASILTARSVK